MSNNIFSSPNSFFLKSNNTKDITTSTTDISLIDKQVEEGLKLAISHSSATSAWPRKISTKLTDGAQITVYSILEAMYYFKQAQYVDCRISAYKPVIPSADNNNSKEEFTDISSAEEIVYQIIDTIMIDIDRSKFKSEREMNIAKDKIIARIYEIFKIRKSTKNKGVVVPFTLIKSGRGYHIYIAIESDGKILEQMSRFKKFEDPSKELLRFGEWYISDGLCDDQHCKTASINNYLLRVPGSINSKNNKQVKVIQKWDGVTRCQAELLYDKFYVWLKDKKEREKNQYSSFDTITTVTTTQVPMSEPFRMLFEDLRKNRITAITAGDIIKRNGENDIIYHTWIENLLKTSLHEHRKYCAWRILVPYFLYSQRMSFEESYNRIIRWLAQCNEIRPLGFNAKARVATWLKRAIKHKYYPISLNKPEREPNTLKTDNPELYQLLKERGCIS